jgi:hypothetical protein
MEIRFILLGMVLFALAGCATLNEQECLTGDWYTIGYEDGAKGRTVDRIGKYRKSCADYDISPDLQAYQAGREEGLQEFCQPQNGFNLGQRGGGYSGVCSVDLELDFVAAYDAGRHLYELRAAVSSASRQINHKKRELDKLEKELGYAEAALINDDTSSEERARLLAETKDMARHQGELESEILHLERDKAVYRDRLAAYQHSLAYNY